MGEFIRTHGFVVVVVVLGHFAVASSRSDAMRCEVVPIDPAAQCVGDCSGDRQVTVDEILRGVHVSLGQAEVDSCHSFDVDRDDAVTVDELLRGVGYAMSGCTEEVVAAKQSCPDGEELCNVAQAAAIAMPAYGKGAAFVDVDGDGWDDIWASDSDSRANEDFGMSALYRNRGDGTFEPFDIGIDPDDLYLNWSASFADYDNDGDPDLLLMNGGYAGDGSLILYRNDLRERGRFTRVNDEAELDAGTETWWGASWADYDLDGWLDFAVTPVTGHVALYRNLGNGKFARIAMPDADTTPARDDMKNPVWIDYNLDGYPDLYVAGPFPTLYHNEGNGMFRDVSRLVYVGSVGQIPYVFAAATADFNQDGWPDLYLGRLMLEDLILLNQGGTGFTAHGTEIGLDLVIGSHESPLRFDDPLWAEGTMGLGVGDFDEDGMPEIFIGTGNPYHKFDDIIFCNTSVPGSAEVSVRRCSEPIVRGHGEKQTHGIILGDIDRDGDMDIFFNLGGMRVYNGELPPNARDEHALYVRDPVARKATATVRLEGTLSNRDAIGTRIQVDGSRRHHYTMQSSQGFQSQNSAAMVLSLGDEQKGLALVTWPSGVECEARLYAGDQVVVREPQGGLRRRRSAMLVAGAPDALVVALPAPVKGKPLALSFDRCEGH